MLVWRAHFSLNDRYLLDSHNGKCQKLIAEESETHTLDVWIPKCITCSFPFSISISNQKVILTEIFTTNTHMSTTTQSWTNILYLTQKRHQTHIDKSIHNSPHPDSPTPIVYQISHEVVKIFDMFTTTTTYKTCVMLSLLAITLLMPRCIDLSVISHLFKFTIKHYISLCVQ